MGKSKSPVSAMTKKARLMAAQEGNARANDRIAREYIRHDTVKPYIVGQREVQGLWNICVRKLEGLPRYRFKVCVKDYAVTIWSVQAESEIDIVWDGEFHVECGEVGMTVHYPDQVIQIVRECAVKLWHGKF